MSENITTAATQAADVRGHVFADVLDECIRNDSRWGDQSHLPDGTDPIWLETADSYRRDIAERIRQGKDPFWADILAEEFHEALAEQDPERLDAELTQIAAVAIAWKEALRKRAKTKP